MKLLLDTHIWIWSLEAPEKLSPRVAGALRRRDHELWLSSMSLWEFLLLARKGRITVNRDPHDWFQEAQAKAPVREAPLTHDIALETGRVRLGHPDPTDSFLVATARVLELTLVTADKRLLNAKQCPTLSNRG